MTADNKPENPMAFPIINAGYVYETGMTLRDYFAAKAMQGLISNFERHSSSANYDVISIVSYKMADEMLNQRKQ